MSCRCCCFLGPSEFFNNTAHGNRFTGFRVYPSWSPNNDPCSTAAGSAPQLLSNNTFFRNGGNGVFLLSVGHVRFVNTYLVENGGDAFFWMQLDPNVGYQNNSLVASALMVGTTVPGKAVRAAAVETLCQCARRCQRHRGATRDCSLM